jgi:hypothetical protein
MRRRRGAPLAAGPSSADRLETPEMRVAALEMREGRAWIEVEVRSSPALAALAPTWSGTRVCVGSHWLDRRGAMAAFDGARSDPLDPDLLELAPVRRRLSLDHRRPEGGERLQIDLVAEGLAWGHQAGLGMLELQRPRGPAMPAARPPAAGPPSPDCLLYTNPSPRDA